MGVDEFERIFLAQNFLVGMMKAENCVRHKTDRTLSRKKRKKKKKKKALNLRWSVVFSCELRHGDLKALVIFS
jgi:hypothetical protein